VDECKPLAYGNVNVTATVCAAHSFRLVNATLYSGLAASVAVVTPAPVVDAAVGRGLHSLTFQLNLSAFCGIGGARRD
jgi:hypothetical protein